MRSWAGLSMVAALKGHIVRDWNFVPLGTVRGLGCNDRTHEPRTLLVRLDPAGQQALGLSAAEIEIPMRFVAGIRRGEVVLDRGAQTIGRGPGFPPS